MIDTSLLVGLALLAGGILPVCAGPTSLAIAATLFVLRRGLRRRALVLTAMALAVSAVRASHAMHAFERERAWIVEALHGPSRCSAVGTVVSSPVLIGRGGGELTPSFTAELTQVECEGRSLGKPFNARLYGGPITLGRGDRVEIIADLSPIEPFLNAELDDPRPGGTRRAVLASGGAHDVRILRRGFGIAALIDRARAHARERIVSTFPADAAPLARALVLGESDLDEADDRAFRASGLSHLLAVSGTHLVLVVAGAVGALGAIAKRVEAWSARYDVSRWSSAFGVVLAWVYADFAGGSGSANRAAAMLSFAFGARALGRRPQGPRAFGLSMVGAGIADPLVAFDISFTLSAAATAGLMLLQRPLAARLASGLARSRDGAPPKGALGSVVTAMATTLSASIGCAPLIAFLSPTLPVGGLFANLVAVPLGEMLALPLCLAHGLLSAVPWLERGAAILAAGSLLIVRAIARLTERANWLMLPVPRPSQWQCAILWSATTACFAVRRRWRVPAALVGAALWLMCELRLARAGAPRGKLRITVLDVGQGDSSLVDFPDGRAMLVDAGGLVGSPVDPGASVVAPLLRARRRNVLAVVALSHPHPDHYGGLAAALERTTVGEFWDTGQGEREGAGVGYQQVLAMLRGRGVSVMRPDALCGAPRSFGRAVVEVLAPCPKPVAFANPNDNSLVLRVSLGRRAALLVGDAEHTEEQGLLGDHRPLRADFLKVGHHGSVTSSTPAFLDAVGAADAAISCGVRNRFGHPHPVSLSALRARLRVHRTDQDGSIEWETDGETTSVRTAAEAERSTKWLPWSILPARYF